MAENIMYKRATHYYICLNRAIEYIDTHNRMLII